MKKRSRKKPKRTGTRRRREQLSKKVRELYPPGAEDDDWGEELDALLEPPPPPGGPQPATPPASAAPGSPAGDERDEDVVGEARHGRVASVWSGGCRVASDGDELDATLPSRLAVRQQQAVAVGDEVLVEELRSGGFRVREVLPRRTVLSRPDPQNPRLERVIAANVDAVVQVVSVVAPPLRPALIDRCLIAVERSGAEAVIAVNKIDLLPDPEERRRELDRLDPYRELGLAVVACSAQTGEGLDALREELWGRTAVLVGHSGVGKSSILGALAPEIDVRTGEVAAWGKGRHTTTRSSLYRLPGDVTLIDTPGIREFGLFEIEPAELPGYFPDFTPHAARCRFSDCLHRVEPDCGVRAAVEAGELEGARHRAYLRILESLEEDRI